MPHKKKINVTVQYELLNKYVMKCYVQATLCEKEAASGDYGLFFFIVKFPNSSLQICANGAFSCAQSVRVASTNKQVTNLINICRGIVESVQGTSAERKVLPKQLKDCRKV